MAIFSKKDKNDQAAGETAQQAEAKEQSTKEMYAEGAKPAAKKGGKKHQVKLPVASKLHRVLVRPLVTEKAATLASRNQYFFEVALDANKIEVAKAVETFYGIKPVSVNIIRMEGKRVSRGRVTGQRKDWKKAMVTLPAGKSINIYEGV